jgi:hypothetical protein
MIASGATTTGFRQIAPGSSCAQDPEDSVQDALKTGECHAAAKMDANDVEQTSETELVRCMAGSLKWHHIGRDSVIEIDGFDGRMIRYGGIKFSGSARDVYWSTIQRYARQKVGQLFDELEVGMQKYPLEIRSNALHWENPEGSSRQRPYFERPWLHIPAQQDLGDWAGAQAFDIESRIATLRHIYCGLEVAKGGDGMVFGDLMGDKVTLVKANGTVVRKNIRAQVSAGQITMFDADLPLEPGDHFLRSLPSGLVEDYVVDEPNFITGIHNIPSSFQSKVHRSREAAAPPQQVIRQITDHFHGDNSRVTFGTDNSINVVNQLQPLAIANLVEQIKPHVDSLPEPQRAEIAAPLKLLEDEIRKGAPEPSKLQGGPAVHPVVEGAAGNLIAAGIQAMITKMLVIPPS